MRKRKKKNTHTHTHTKEEIVSPFICFGDGFQVSNHGLGAFFFIRLKEIHSDKMNPNQNADTVKHDESRTLILCTGRRSHGCVNVAQRRK